MKQTKALSNYTQFRKKYTNIKQNIHQQIGQSQIDQLTQQLQNINSIKLIHIKKYAHPNGIIQQEQQQQISYRNSQKKNINQNIYQKKIKLPNGKIQTKNNNYDHKISIHPPQYCNKKTKIMQQTPKNSNKNQKKQDPQHKTTQHQKTIKTSRNNSLISTNQSVNTTITSISDKNISQSQKKKLLTKIKSIKLKIQQKIIHPDMYQKLIKSIQNLDKIIDNF